MALPTKKNSVLGRFSSLPLRPPPPPKKKIRTIYSYCRLAVSEIADLIRERKMRTNFLCTNFLNTPRGPRHPGKIPGTSQIPLFETQGRQTFEGGHELFVHHPFTWKTPTPSGGLRIRKVNLGALFSCLIDGASDGKLSLKITVAVVFGPFRLQRI